MTLRPGKLPADSLARLLAGVPHLDPRVLYGPGIGRDAAVLDLGGGRVLVAKTDPVTFAAHDIGWYAVHVNANDVACMGARPAWMLASVLLPPGAPDGLPATIMSQLGSACGELGIELVGGHTEITLGLDRPIVVGAMLGEAASDAVVTGENMVPGDRVLLTKGIAIEGSALLARESAPTLAARGVAAETVASAARLLFDPGISIVREARLICEEARPRLMHDATEGGLSTALYELAEAGGVGLRIDPGAISVLSETAAICDALELDPMGLLASGSLLAIVGADDSEATLKALRDAGVDCGAIGEVVPGPVRVILGSEDSAAPLIKFDRDELARFYSDAPVRDRGMTQPPEGT